MAIVLHRPHPCPVTLLVSFYIIYMSRPSMTKSTQKLLFYDPPYYYKAVVLGVCEKLSDTEAPLLIARTDDFMTHITASNTVT
jgi:hypothetical protein